MCFGFVSNANVTLYKLANEFWADYIHITYLYEMYMNTVKLNISNSNVQTKANIAS